MRKKQGAESFGVIGLGRFGTALAITIAKAGKDVIVIDRNEAKVKELRQYTDYAFVVDEPNAEIPSNKSWIKVQSGSRIHIRNVAMQTTPRDRIVTR